ncbi:MAG: hypothetical protein KJP07_19745 [Desulfatitalea sp.]|nr:hypothetical protein [Desulfatitalea sp.]
MIIDEVGNRTYEGVMVDITELNLTDIEIKVRNNKHPLKYLEKLEP